MTDNIIGELIPIIATAASPQVASVGIVILTLAAILIVVSIRNFSKKEMEALHEFDLSLSARQRKKISDENKTKYTKKCLDETIRLLKSATIKKTYKNFAPFTLYGDRSRTIYTIPLNLKEAVMYIWGKVIAQTSPKEQDRVIRMAAIILGVLEDNKNKHILELEAQAIAGTKIYGNADGENKLQIRAVDNVDNVQQGQLMLPLGVGAHAMTAEKTEFFWPSSVASAVKKLREFSLIAIANGDLQNYAVFPCSSCKSDCSIFELEDLKCPNCRKK